MDYRVKWLGMAFPTVLLYYWLTYKSHSSRSDFFHNLAVSCSITGNSIWMAGEFYFDDKIRQLVIPVFVAELAVINNYYLSDFFSGNTGSFSAGTHKTAAIAFQTVWILALEGIVCSSLLVLYLLSIATFLRLF